MPQDGPQLSMPTPALLQRTCCCELARNCARSDGSRGARFSFRRLQHCTHLRAARQGGQGRVAAHLLAALLQQAHAKNISRCLGGRSTASAKLGLKPALLSKPSKLTSRGRRK